MSNKHAFKRLTLYTAVWSLVLVGVALATHLPKAAAADATNDSDFSLQITPSPIVTSVRPGTTNQVELKIRNAGTATEKLKIEPHSFKINSDGSTELNDTAPADVASWISFANPTFTVQPGQWFTEEIKLTVPKDTGFSYSFAFIISRQSLPKLTSSGRLIEGSVAVFTLINIDRPGATRQLNVAKFSSNRKVYEYLPSTLTINLKNTGNSIVQPFGNIFIQRGSADKRPLATLPVNDQKGYILPGVTRSFTAQWNSGLPHYVSTTGSDGKAKNKLIWDLGNAKLSSFRIGRYTARLVAVYDDGRGHDVPIEGEISFWVIPWKILLAVFIVLAVFITFTVIAINWYFKYWRPIRKDMKAARKEALQKYKEKKESKHD